jgi:RHS repeat-associated protein
LPLDRLYETSAGTAASITRMLYDGDELLAEYNAGGNMLRRYIHGTGSDDPLNWYEGATMSAATRRHMFANYQGSITAVADSAGTTLGINRYDEWGIPAATNIGRFGYTGQAWLPEIGLYYYKARIYSPTLGRFMQTDPIGYEDDINLYAYVGNDPSTWVDPTGEGKVRWFVETVKGAYKAVSDKIAKSSREAGKNVEARGPGSSGKARRLENKVISKNNVTRHDPHTNGKSGHKGTSQPHYQPENRKTGGQGHTFYSTVASTVTGAAVTFSDGLQAAGDTIGATREERLPDDASELRRGIAKTYDFFDPTVEAGDILRGAADIIRPKDPKP